MRHRRTELGADVNRRPAPWVGAGASTTLAPAFRRPHRLAVTRSAKRKSSGELWPAAGRHGAGLGVSSSRPAPHAGACSARRFLQVPRAPSRDPRTEAKPAPRTPIVMVTAPPAYTACGDAASKEWRLERIAPVAGAANVGAATQLRRSGARAGRPPCASSDCRRRNAPHRPPSPARSVAGACRAMSAGPSHTAWPGTAVRGGRPGVRGRFHGRKHSGSPGPRRVPFRFAAG